MNMRQYSNIDLAKPMTDDMTLRAGDDLRQLNGTAAWFRICQLFEEDKRRVTEILRERPQGKTVADYAEASGLLRGLDIASKYFEKIAKEAKELSE